MADVFRPHRYALRFFGVTLPGDIKRGWLRSLVDIYMVLLQACCLFWACLFFRAGYLYTLDNFMNRVEGVTAGISVAGSASKYFVFRTRGRLLKDLMDVLGDFDCATSRGKLISKVNKFYAGSVMMIIVTHNIFPLYEDFHRNSPYYAEKQYGPWSEVLRDYTFSLSCAVVTLSGNVIGDVIFLTLTSQLCHKIHLLANTVSRVGRGGWEEPEGKDVMDIPGSATDRVIIRICVQEHNRLLRLKDQLQDLFKMIILIQLTYSFADTCFTLFAVSQFENMFEAIKELLPQFVALFLEIFLYCWGGEMIHTHFEILHKATYDSEWYNCRDEDRSSLLIMQSFTTKPVNMTAGIFNFNFKFYETLCRETFSYYTLMYQFFSQK